jgi:hypothetical protein
LDRYFLLRKIAVALHARSLTSPQERATDRPVALSGVTGAARVLLLGSGVTSGWGVTTHGLALVGSLQQGLQARLGRSVDVEQVSGIGVTLDQAVDLLADRAREEWDAIVIAFGLSDAMCLTPPRAWARALDRLLAKLDGDMPDGMLVPIVVVGIPPLDLIGLMTPLTSIFRGHPDRLNVVTLRAVARARRTSWVPLSAMEEREGRPGGSPAAYRTWGAAIAEGVAARLPDTVGVGPGDWSVVAPLVAATLSPTHAMIRERLASAASRLRDEVDADFALVNLTSGGRLYNVAGSHTTAPRSVPLADTFCAATLGGETFFALDAAAEPRFAGLRHAFRSYMGITLRDPTGAPVGTLCAFDGGAGDRTHDELLRSIAAEVEEQLHLLGQGAPPAEDKAVPMTSSSAAAVLEQAPSWEATDHGNGSRLRYLLHRRVRLRSEGAELTRTSTRRAVPEQLEFRIQGPDPFRVLLVGGEYAVGFGATDRAQALDGALAKLLHRRTGRGVVVENRSRHLVRLEQLASSLGSAGAATFDLVVWTPTFMEATRVLLRTRWIAGLGLMLRKVRTTSDAAVLLVGFPSLIGLQPLAVLGRARARQINRLLRLIAARHRGVMMAEPAPVVLATVDTVDAAKTYHDAAVRLLPAALELLQPVMLPRQQETEDRPADSSATSVMLPAGAEGVLLGN